MKFIKSLVNVSIYRLSADILEKPQGAAPPCSCFKAGSPLAYSHAPCLPPPTFVFSSELWLSERRKMCNLQVLLQH